MKASKLNIIITVVFCCLLTSMFTYAQTLHNKNLSPTSIVKGFYDGSKIEMMWPSSLKNQSKIHSRNLSNLYKNSMRKHGQFALTFDPIVNGQDALISELTIDPAIVKMNRAVVHVRFKNFQADNVIVYNFVLEGGTWKLDDIASIGGETRWILSDILKQD